MEKWIKIEELDNLYSVSNKGRVKSNRTDKILKPKTDKDGYQILVVNPTKNRVRNMAIHRLVLMKFNPINNPENYHVHHKDFDTSNNNINNLEWLSPKDNLSIKLKYISSFIVYKKLLYKLGNQPLKKKLEELLLP